MSILDAIILGIIQGLTEFLPVSSSGHIELGKSILGIEIKEDVLFTIVLHCATVLSTIIIFRKYIWEVMSGVFQFEWNDSTQFLVKIVLSMIPVGIVGVFFEKTIESFFDGQILLVGTMLLFTGALLLLTNYLEKPSGKDVNPLQAILIGIAQAIAVLPGISRSGATIATSLLLGVEREKAARFSFLMVIPPILGATLLKVKDFLEMTSAGDASSTNVNMLIVGFVAAFVTGLVACQWMIQIVKKGKLMYFAVYCFLVGGIAVVFQLVFN